MKLFNRLAVIASVIVLLFLGGCEENPLGTQTPDNIILDAETPDSLCVSAAGGPFTLHFHANADWYASTDASWLTILSDRYGVSGEATLSFSVEKHEASDVRMGHIRLSAGEANAELIVVQAAAGAIILTQKSYRLDCAATTLTVEFKSNLAYEVILPACDWISEPQTRALQLHKKDYTIAANNQDDARQAVIIIRGKAQPALADTIHVIQTGQAIVKERTALCAIYDKLGGVNWSQKDNWCTEKPVSSWYGVKTNEEGRVVSLDFQAHLLVGEFPIELCELKALVDLRMGGSGTMTGEIPPQIGQLVNLEHLYLGGNRLSGSIPAEICQLTKLKSLELSHNALTGSLPQALGELRALSFFNASNNELSGTIPADLFELPQLSYAWLDNNRLSGTLPTTIGKATHLRSLSLANNELSGSLPVELAAIMGNLDWRSAQHTGLTNNRFSGTISEAIYHHAKWGECWRKIVPQKVGAGFSLTAVPLPAYTFQFKDINGTMQNLGAIYASHTYTVLFQWDHEHALMYSLAKALDAYKQAGLGVVMFDNGNGSMLVGEEATILTKTGATNCINFIKADHGSFNPGDWNETVYNMITSSGCTSVQAEVVDQQGNIVFSYIPSADDDSRFNHKTETDLIPFLTTLFGPMPAAFYESTDYSEDGKITTLQTASVGKGIDLVFIGDGFTDKAFGQGGQYETWLRDAVDAFFSVEPVKSFKDRFNVYLINAVSKHEEMIDGSTTALGSYLSSGSHIQGNVNKTWSFIEKQATGRIDIDLQSALVIQVINSTKWAGTAAMNTGFAGSIAYCPYPNHDFSLFKIIVAHEAVGHGLGKLADEYWYPGSYWPIPDWKKQELTALYTNYGWYSNIDFTNNPQTIRWADFLSSEAYQSSVGIFAGGYLDYTDGVFRPSENSVMHSYTLQFNAPSRWAIYQALMEWSGEACSFDAFLQYDRINLGAASNMPAARTSMPFRQFTSPPQVITRPSRRED